LYNKEEGGIMGIGTTELLIILAIVLVLFGAGRIPEVGLALGKGIRNFKKALRGEEEKEITPHSPALPKEEEQLESSLQRSRAGSESPARRE
jgi:sec-independent protein translocase protein TatA